MMNKWTVLQERAENWHLNQLYLPAASYTYRLGRNIGADYGQILAIFHDAGGFAVYGLTKEIEVVEGRVLGLLKEKPQLIFEFSRRFRHEIARFKKFCEGFGSEALRKKSRAELGELYRKYYEIYLEIYQYSEPLPFAMGEVLAKELESHLKGALKKKGKSAKFGEYFALLSASPKKPFATREEESLLELTLEIKDNKEFGQMLKKSLDLALERLAEYPKIKSMLDRHSSAFYWVPFDYAGRTWSRKHFLKTAKEYNETGFNAKKRLSEMRAYFNKLEARQKNLAGEIGIDDAHFNLFRILQEGSYLIDLKKEEFTKCHHHLKSLQEEMARRIGIKWLEACYLTPPELADWCITGRVVQISKIRERMKLCVLFVDGEKIHVFEGERAADFIRKEGLDLKSMSTPLEVKGTCACGGNVTGPAKIVRKAAELSKLEKGDILVTLATTPDFVRGMKIAAAIVTDEGGLTSHAAIVSRELGTPCVVGTKIASKVFKDGEMLEVRASHGIVRKISNK